MSASLALLGQRIATRVIDLSVTAAVGRILCPSAEIPRCGECHCTSPAPRVCPPGFGWLALFCSFLAGIVIACVALQSVAWVSSHGRRKIKVKAKNPAAKKEAIEEVQEQDKSPSIPLEDLPAIELRERARRQVAAVRARTRREGGDRQ